MRTKPTLLLLAFMMLGNYIYSQTVVCENASCTANDYTLDYFYLGDSSGTPFGPGYCEPGSIVNAHIWSNFNANAAAARYSLYLHFNLYVDGVFIDTVDACYYENQSVPINVELDLLSFDWNCGSEITLEDFYMSWQPNSQKDCDCNNAKCYKEATILVRAPLIANYEFFPSCETAYTLEFNSTTSGGVPPYTYLWDFGDGTTSTEASPTKTYTSTGPYTVSLTVYDMENTDSFEQLIVNFPANLPPEIYAPTNRNLEGCSIADLPYLPYSSSAVQITEAQLINAGGSVVLSNDLVSITYSDVMSGTCPTTITRTFTVLDSCYNTDTDTQIFTIDDSTLPTANNPASISVSCNADIPSPNTNVVSTVNDACSNTTISFVNDSSDGKTCPETIVRTYRVTDGCGNSIDVTQTIIVNDDVPPTASNPATLNIECTGTIPAPNVNVVTNEADNCSTPTVTFVGDTPQTGSCPITILRTYKVTDDCGNSLIVTQQIIINDTVAPTATGPTNLTVQCSSEIPAPNINDVTNAADDCSSTTVEYVGDVTNAGSCPEVITRTYSVKDQCGNEKLITQNITIVDDVAPYATAPSDISVQCADDIPAPDISVISDVVDNCGVPVVSFISDVATGTCPQNVIRTYRVEDSCGNSRDIIQNINVIDDVPPTASDPDPIYVDCSEGIPANNPNVVIDATDNCSAPIITFVSDVSDGQCPETITRKYRVKDLCGNFIDVTQLIITTDDSPPTLISVLDDETVSCTAIPDPTNPTFIDDCDADITVDFLETSTNNNNTVDYVITRTWTVTDNCGNVADFTKLINVEIADCIVSVCNSCGIEDDIIPPTATDPADTNVACGTDIPPPNPEVVIDEADNCLPPVVAFVSEDVSVDCLEKVVRVYSVTDECGNVIYVTHRINVIDTEIPVANNPSPVNLTCTQNIPAPDVSVVTATDNCSQVKISFVSDTANEGCEGRIVRKYRVTDNCGNFTEVTQEFNIIDDVAPTATGPSDITVSCIENIPIPNINVITNLADNCSTPLVSFISDVSDDNICPETITRTYRVTDECGNFTDIVQLIIVQDEVLPTASNPASLTFACVADIPAPDMSVVIDEDDNCSTPVVAFVSDVSDNLSCPETIIRTYSITDICGNSIEVNQTITVDDNIDPTASNGETLQVQTLSDVPNPNPEVITDEADNCGVPTVAFVSESSDGAECPETITRIYSVTDACENTINVEHKIVVGNFINPIVITPASLAVQCIGDVPTMDISIIEAQAADGSSVTVEFISEASNNQTCPEIITRIYRATDECGNYTDVLHTIVIDDDIPPTGSDPETLTFNDRSLIPAVDIEVVIDEADNCGIPSVEFVSEISNNDGCEEILTRTYSITDACGNSIAVNHDIIIVDDAGPTASSPPDLKLSCEEAIPEPDPSIITDAVDSSNPIEIYYVSQSSDQQTCPETLTRIYRVIDACGNFTEVEHRIIIDDEILPTASDAETTEIVGSENIPPPDPEVILDEADNCGVPTVEFVSEESNNDPCLEVITRVYSVTDACDNQILVNHIINVVIDNEDPQAEIPGELTFECLDDVPEPDISIVVATDNRSTPIITFVSESKTQDKCGQIIKRIYNVADQCGNSIDIQHIINIADTVAPELSTDLEGEITLVCQEEPGVPTVAFVDNCSASSVSVSFSESFVELEGGSYDIIRTWTAKDSCNNETEAQQIIHMINTTSEKIENVSLCIGDPPLNLMNFVENEGGTWSGEFAYLLENESFLDPTYIPEGDYKFTYNWASNACASETVVFVNVNDLCINYPCIRTSADVNISKMVTPNADGFNDYFEVGYILNSKQNKTCDLDIFVQIFNRWGAKVYEDPNYQNTWDGNSPSASLGNAGKLPAGAYYYIVDIKNSGLNPIQGYIHLGTK